LKVSVNQFQNEEVNLDKKERRNVDAETVCNPYREASIHWGYLHSEHVEKN